MKGAIDFMMNLLKNAFENYTRICAAYYLIYARF